MANSRCLSLNFLFLPPFLPLALAASRPTLPATTDDLPGYGTVLASISELLARARHSTAQAINSILTATYWEIGRRVVEFEQRGQARAAYGEQLWKRLADDLTARHGRGFSKSNIALMRAFYLQWEIFQTPSGKFAVQVKDSPFSQHPDRSSDEATDSQLTVAADVPDHVGAFHLCPGGIAQQGPGRPLHIALQT